MKKGRWTEEREGKNTGVGIRREKEGEGSGRKFYWSTRLVCYRRPAPPRLDWGDRQGGKTKTNEASFFPVLRKAERKRQGKSLVGAFVRKSYTCDLWYYMLSTIAIVSILLS